MLCRSWMCFNHNSSFPNILSSKCSFALSKFTMSSAKKLDIFVTGGIVETECFTFSLESVTVVIKNFLNLGLFNYLQVLHLR